jgi:hypothetical protein
MNFTAGFHTSHDDAYIWIQLFWTALASTICSLQNGADIWTEANSFLLQRLRIRVIFKWPVQR